MHQPSNPLRKAAVLIWSLDRRSADALLDQMPAEQAARVRQAVMDLGEIDSAEQQQVITEFLRGKQATADSGGVEIDSSLARKFAALENSTASSFNPEPTATAHHNTVAAGAGLDKSTIPQTPFRFLQNATSDAINKFLEREHPQTVALVVAHLPPARAAEIVTRLPAPLQADVLRRVADLDETNPEVVRELEESLQHLLADELRACRRRTAGLAAVGAILNAAAETARDEMLSNLAQTDADLAVRLTPRPSEELEPKRTIPEARAKSSRLSFFWSRSTPAATPEPESVGNALRGAATNVGNALRGAARFQDLDADDEPDAEPFEDEPNLDDTELEDLSNVYSLPEQVVEFDDFAQFDNAALAAVFKAADPRIAILALTGARRELVARLLKQLPNREAKALRRQMEQSGPLRLRDVEVAQRQLALLASRLAAQDKIKLPVIRRFAAAA